VPRPPVFVLALLALALSCRRAEQGGTTGSTSPAAKAEPGGDEVVATYAGRRLTRGQVVQELERLPGPSRAYLSAPDRKRQFVENMILNDLLFDEGKTDGFDRDPDIERQVNDLRKRLVVQKVMRKYQTPPEVTDDEARAYYEANKALYSTTQIRASHILVKDEETARALVAELRAHPERFADLAREKSTDTATAAKGGDLGFFAPGRMVPDFERVAFALPVGQLSDVVKTQYGYHVILVTERKEGEQKPFEQVKEQIKATLRNRALQDQVQSHFDALKRQADVHIDDAELAKITLPAATAPQPALFGH
jgi:peptidyl-prolyl cis-trans isomerase C